MNINKANIPVWIFAACVAVAAAAANAGEPGTTSRDERMDAALANYRASHPSGTPTSGEGATNAAMEPRCDDVAANDSALSRAEAAMKRGACKTGRAIDRGVHKAGAAAGRVGHKAGDAVRRAGSKYGGSTDKSDTSKSDPQAR